jgi:hypothetical protein
MWRRLNRNTEENNEKNRLFRTECCALSLLLNCSRLSCETNLMLQLSTSVTAVGDSATRSILGHCPVSI